MNHIENRRWVVEALKREIVGPDPMGDEIALVDGVVYTDRPVCQKRTLEQERDGVPAEEILRAESPTQRYGVGVLYPLGAKAAGGASPAAALDVSGSEEEAQDLDDPELAEDNADYNAIRDRSGRGGDGEEEEPQAFTLESANRFQPSSMGVSFIAQLTADDTLIVEVTGGRYRPRQVIVREPKGADETEADAPEDGTAPPSTWKPRWWLREPVTAYAEFPGHALLAVTDAVQLVDASPSMTQSAADMNLSVEAYVRGVQGRSSDERLITLVLVNRSKGSTQEEYCLFQSRFRACIKDAAGCEQKSVLPYARAEKVYSNSEILTEREERTEEESLDLLYRDAETFAVGHGCAADWDKKPEGGRVREIIAEPFPLFETPSVTPDLKAEDGSMLRVYMHTLANFGKDDGAAVADLARIIQEYRSWIERMRGKAEELKDNRAVALTQLDVCEACATRMQEGLDFLRSDKNARLAFRLANHAMFLQRFRSRLSRTLPMGRRAAADVYPPLPDINAPGSEAPYWRPFQIAFILMTLRSTVLADDPDRESVELIWFPTGGGKTEAYLGLAAFSILYRRLMNPGDDGTQVIMRYTLRLLTQQQLQRAASLICALEHLRASSEDRKRRLGTTRFSVGIWVGGDVTPGDRQAALQRLHALQREGKLWDGNLLILTRCPWCGMEMKAVRRPDKKYDIYGAEETAGTVKYVCTDGNCEFRSTDDGGRNIPVEFIDEDLYKSPPTLVIGTVDKFATMHHRPEARALFGWSPPENEHALPVRRVSPPGLIIQDELHLISGPLGSMVGLYEGLVERLATDDRTGAPLRPKIVCSTATIRRYKAQARALFGRGKTRLFPSPGIDAGDSFFGRYARDETTGELLQGRLYVGVHPTGYTSGQTARVRTFFSLLQSPFDLINGRFAAAEPGCEEPECGYRIGPRLCKGPEAACTARAAQDPWWTMLTFFNSLRDLGNAIALFQSDIPDYRQTVLKRLRCDPRRLRKAYRPVELTSRLRNDEIPATLSDLEVRRLSRDKTAVGTCLASNIIEVGIDVDRLSLMCVVAQPKATSTYIQVTGRVGRDWVRSPGLVVTLFAADRPRDRSHFERFRSYHERLYAQVEPTSVTPFSEPALERALHGVYSAYVRLLGTKSEAERPDPYPEAEINAFLNYLYERVKRCGFGNEERMSIHTVASKRLVFWKSAPPQRWNVSSFSKGEAGSLLTSPSGDPNKTVTFDLPWETPLSMRSVDASCKLAFSNDYVDTSADVTPLPPMDDE